MGTRPAAPRVLRLAVALAASLLLCLPLTTANALDRADQSPQGRLAVENNDRVAVVDGYRSRLVPALATPIGWTGSVAGCDPGAPSAAGQQATLDAVNYFRSMAGLDPVTFDEQFSAQAQQAALMMQAEGNVSHTPTSDWACRTEEGAAAAGRSNIVLGAGGADAIALYMVDSGALNHAVGHRRWILNPQAKVLGSGSTSGANALWVFPSGEDGTATSPEWIPWPTAGYFPSQLEPRGRWSLSGSDRNLNFDAADVTVLGPAGQPMALTVWPAEDGYGPHTISWELVGVQQPTAENDLSYAVTVDGITRDDPVAGETPVPPVTYTVTLVNASLRFTVVRAPKLTGTPRVGQRLVLDRGEWTPQPTRFVYRWSSGAVPVSSATSYTLRASDLGKVVKVSMDLERASVETRRVLLSTGTTVLRGFAPRPIVLPRIRGFARVGARLSATPGTWSVAPNVFQYTWFRGTLPVMRGPVYRPREADVGRRLTVRVRVTKPGYQRGQFLTAKTARVSRS